MKTLLIAVVSVALSVAAQFSLKAGMSSDRVRDLLVEPYTVIKFFAVLRDKYILGGFLLYGLGAIIWLGVLSKWDVSKAYPLVGLGFVFTIAIGILIGEQVSSVRLIGVALICTGVFIVGQS
jgi:multidrug transporter EmrE-like cation transporter